MTVISSSAKKTLVALILRFHKSGMSYRRMAKLITRTKENGKPVLTGATINRIAKTRGKWLPKSKEILSILGLLESPRMKKIFEMPPKELLWRLQNREKF